MRTRESPWRRQLLTGLLVALLVLIPGAVHGLPPEDQPDFTCFAHLAGGLSCSIPLTPGRYEVDALMPYVLDGGLALAIAAEDGSALTWKCRYFEAVVEGGSSCIWHWAGLSIHPIRSGGSNGQGHATAYHHFDLLVPGDAVLTLDEDGMLATMQGRRVE